LRASWAFRRPPLPTRAPAWASPRFSKCNSTTAPIEPLRGGSPDPPRDQTALARFSRRVRRPAALSGAVVIRKPALSARCGYAEPRPAPDPPSPRTAGRQRAIPVRVYAQNPQTSQIASSIHSPVMYNV
jgi:hypothetical protein